MKLDSFSAFGKIAVVALILIFPAASGVYAEDDIQVEEVDVNAPKASPMPKTAPATQEIRQSLPPDAGLDSSEITVLRDNYAGAYNSATLDNLARMYWRLGAFDLQDDIAISNYIKITNCKVFTDFVNDDMEWRKIIGTMRTHLKDKRDTFPLNFQFVIELHLGRYDPERGGFTIEDKTGFKDAKRIEVDSIDAEKEVCFDNTPINDYPKSMFILLPQPFTLDFIKLNEHVAQAYILRKKSEYSKLEESLRVRRYERDAFLRLRMTFSQYHGNLSTSDNDLMGILYGVVDGYEIFEDASQQRLMLSVDLKDQPATAPDKTSMISLPPVTVPDMDVSDVYSHITPAAGATLVSGQQAFTQ